jgi:hypothetical protein
MKDHEQEVIDGFVKAVIPAIIQDEGQWSDTEYFDHDTDSVSRAYSIAGELFAKHKETCKICRELSEKQNLEIF